MRFATFLALVVCALATICVGAETTALRNGVAAESPRYRRSLLGGTEAARKMFEEMNQKAALDKISKKIAKFTQKAQLSDDQLAILAKFEELEKAGGGKVAAAVSEGVKNQGDDVAKVLAEGMKKDDDVATLVAEVAKKDGDVAKVVAEGAKLDDEVAKLAKIISSGGQADDQSVKLAAAIVAATKAGGVSDKVMAQLPKMLVQEMKKATPKKTSLLKKIILAALGVTVGYFVIRTAMGLMNPKPAAA